MSGLSFTPGPWVPNDQHSGANPWRVESDDGISKNDGWIIADLLGPDAEANARLIAAAPMLYEALVRLGTLAAAKYGNSDDEIWGAITQGIAACAKARGETA